MKTRICLVVCSTLMTVSAFAGGIGFSTHPWGENKKIISTEFTGVVSTGGGVGLQARFTSKQNDKLIVDGGFGISGGIRTTNSVFFGADYELYPDYQRQPRISVKGTLENRDEFGQRTQIVGIAPTFSKGFSFWGKEAFPYVAIPVSVGLKADNTYNTRANLSLGMTGQIPHEDFKSLTASAEANVNLINSGTGLFVGLSYSIN